MLFQLCRHCGNEKLRRSSNLGFTYYCICREWKVHMNVLKRARGREDERPTRRLGRRERSIPAWLKGSVMSSEHRASGDRRQ
jgi:hypothetical protein